MPSAHGLGRGGLRRGLGLGGGGMWPPGHFPSQGCLRDASEPTRPGVLDKGGRRVRPAVRLRHGWSLVGEPPFSRLEEVVAKAAREGCLMLIIAPEWPGLKYPWWAALCALCPKRWQFPQDRPLYLRGGTDLMLAPKWRRGPPCWTHGRVDRRKGPTNTPHHHHLSRPTTHRWPHFAGGTPRPGPGRLTHGGPPPHGHPALRESARKG